MAAPLWVTRIYALLWIIAASVEFLRLYIKPFRAYHLIFLIGPVLIWVSMFPWATFSLAAYLFAALVIQGLLWLFVFSSKPQLLFPFLILPLYLGFIPAHFVLLKAQALQQNLGYAWLIFPLGVIWINDSAAYLLGTFLGRTPLCPNLSPGKTVEGFVAGVVLSVGFGVGFAALFLRKQPLWWAAVLALVVALAGVLGDLLESAIKRERGVKHSSRLLWGHGGVLDGIDGLIFGTAAYYYLTLILGTL
jgi:phosphatidate cytidylyltransferase